MNKLFGCSDSLFKVLQFLLQSREFDLFDEAVAGLSLVLLKRVKLLLEFGLVQTYLNRRLSLT